MRLRGKLNPGEHVIIATDSTYGALLPALAYLLVAIAASNLRLHGTVLTDSVDSRHDLCGRYSARCRAHRLALGNHLLPADHPPARGAPRHHDPQRR